MPKVESAPVEKESILEKAGRFIFKILGIGILIGTGYIALKKIVIPGIGKMIDKINQFVES